MIFLKIVFNRNIIFQSDQSEGYSGSCSVSSAFTYGAFTLSGRLSQNRSTNITES